MTIAQMIASRENPHERAIACFSRRELQRDYVVYHFADESTLRFAITYTLEMPV